MRPNARAALAQRDYTCLPVPQKIAGPGVEVSQAIAHEKEIRAADAWIPGVEIFPRKVFPQMHRGCFSELGRNGEGLLARLGIPLTQWSAARMFAGTSKGFHIHPPFIPEGHSAADWFRSLFEGEGDVTQRPYSKEQWDVMFFLQGRAEILLVDERDGMARRVMRILIEGDNHRGVNNAGVIIPPGVAHALHVEGAEDLITVYGTTTTFAPENEGRIAHSVEFAPLPPSWEAYINRTA